MLQKVQIVIIDWLHEDICINLAHLCHIRSDIL